VTDSGKSTSLLHYGIYYVRKIFYDTGPEAGSLNKSSCLAPALGVTKFISVMDMILVTLCYAT